LLQAEYANLRNCIPCYHGFGGIQLEGEQVPRLVYVHHIGFFDSFEVADRLARQAKAIERLIKLKE
jgi:hypothetical protein